MSLTVTFGTMDINQNLFKFLSFLSHKEYSIFSKDLNKMLINADVVKVVPEVL